jgi:hypothetical protein
MKLADIDEFLIKQILGGNLKKDFTLMHVDQLEGYCWHGIVET